MPSERIIFLDIDGVLNCKSTPNPRKLPYISLIRRCSKGSRASSSARGRKWSSSTWRYDPARLFSARHWGIPFVDVIPDMPHQPRRDEIITWLKTHGNDARFAVLDDEDDELDELPLFQPSAATGITEEIAEGMAAYLLEETDKDMRHNRLERWFQNIYCMLRGHEG
jgi:HAD domain in Swiss Army Knife RNA repair proteins